MKKHKLKKGEPIKSLDRLFECEWVIVNGKPLSRGWVMSWQLRTAGLYVQGGRAFEGVRLTNGEYYDKLTEEQIRARFGGYQGEIHKVCPYGKDRHIVGECGAGYCDDALRAWKEAPVT